MTDRLEAAIRELVEAIRDEIHAPQLTERLYSVSDAAELFDVARSTLYGEIQSGRLRSIKVGSRRLIPSSAVREYIEAQPGFSEAIREGEQQIAAGQSVRLSEIRSRRPRQ